MAADPRQGFAQTYQYGLNNPISGAVIGGVGAYISSGGDWDATWRGAGALLGAAVGSFGALGFVYGGAAFGVIGAGLGTVAGNSAGSWITGGGYGWGDAGRDFLWGAAGAAVGIRIGQAWLAPNSPGPRPANTKVKCPPNELPSGHKYESNGRLRDAKGRFAKDPNKPPTSSGWNAGANANILSKNIEAKNITRPTGSVAHHIVSGGDKRAAEARSILPRYKVDLNEAGNGVFLPATKPSPNPNGSAVHSTIHRYVLYKVDRAPAAGG